MSHPPASPQCFTCPAIHNGTHAAAFAADWSRAGKTRRWRCPDCRKRIGRGASGRPRAVLASPQPAPGLLRSLRLAAGHTLKQAVAVLGWSNCYLSMVESGKRAAPARVVAAYREHYGDGAVVVEPAIEKRQRREASAISEARVREMLRVVRGGAEVGA